ncbi:7302_t:CDS:2 [Dentiscutata heterogama]|uniref:7302_t:CDS:1 n=1 Tax=Dentiscutata heterogama TaxID=1316150 RepID=A0ACA9JWS1_9GLOM|nr:7302_t:CDS:2 [Dentiscutata heterogama]
MPFLVSDIKSLQDELQEYLVDIQILSNNKNNNDDPIFDFEQDLYEQALETGGEFIKEIPSVKAKPITSCVIINNNHKKIHHCNETSTKSVRELLGV